MLKSAPTVRIVRLSAELILTSKGPIIFSVFGGGK